jgi:SM-20-related protein
MQSALDVASRLGALVVPDFIEAGVRETLLAEVRAAPSEPAPLYRASAEGSRVEQSKHSRLVSVSQAREEDFSDRIRALMPDVARHFGLTLSDQTSPSFLTYREGHHVPPHPDTRPEAEDPIVRDRKITAVTFLNGQREEPDSSSFSGGELVLYGLLGPGSKRHGLPIGGEPGTLVAFRSEVLHEVRPVQSGERQTVVSWYL